MTTISRLNFFTDPNLLGHYFARGLPDPWRVVLKVLDGTPLTDAEMAIFQHHTGRKTVPKFVRELWLKIGRRGLKTTIMAGLAVYEATVRDHRANLPPGTVGTLMVIAADKSQAGVASGYCVGMLESSPLLKQRMTNVTAESIELGDQVAIEIHSPNFRRVRGRTLIGALLDELCFWPTDDSSALTDVEALRALRPSMLTVPTARLVAGSSPYRRAGVMWTTFQKHEAVDDSDVLCWSGTSLEMNPFLPKDEIEAAMAEDPIATRAEYLGEWRDDVNSLLDPTWIEIAVDLGVFERMPINQNTYLGYCDVSGGRRDSFGLGISHKEQDGVVVLDCIREVTPPCEPQAVIAEFAQILKEYGVWSVGGDRYSAEFVVSAFKQHGITYKTSDTVTSDLLLESVGLFSARNVRLLEHPRLRMQLLGLERRARASGRDIAGHAPTGHDDVAVAAIGSLIAASKKPVHLRSRGPRQTHALT